MFPIASKTWFANKSTTQHTFSSKIRKKLHQIEGKQSDLPANFIPKHAAIYSGQIIYSDNSYNKIELYRLDQSNLESRNLTGGRHRDNLATVNFSRFTLHII